MLKKILIFLLLCSVSSGTVSLEVPLEMIDYGISSSTSAITFFRRSMISLTDTNYDGATFYFEVVGSNGNVNNAYSPVLYNVTDSSSAQTVSIPASTVVTLFRSAAFTPASGTKTYAVGLPATTANNNVRIFTARIIVVQVNATKTYIQIPLTQAACNIYSNADTSAQAVDSRSSNTYGQNASAKFSIYNKITTSMADIAGWTWEVVGSATSASGGAAGLWNTTDTTQVVTTWFTSSTITLTVAAETANNATNFHESDNFQCYMRGSGDGAVSCYVYRAALYVRLTNLTKGEVFWRVGKGLGGGSSSSDLAYVYNRALLTTNNYSTPVVYFEATGSSSAANDTCYLQDDTTNDSGTGGSAVSGSTITYIQTTKSRVRSNAITLTSGDRFYGYDDAISGSISPTSMWTIIDCSPAVTPSGQIILITGEN